MFGRNRVWMRKYGWYSHVSERDPSSPTGFNFHTHGFRESVHHLDIQIVLPLPDKTLQGIAKAIYERIKAGASYKEGDVVSGVVGNKLTFIQVLEDNREVLRVILPAENGELFTGLENVDPDYSLQWQVVPC